MSKIQKFIRLGGKRWVYQKAEVGWAFVTWKASIEAIEPY
jgi:hypothetical protein